VGEVVCETRKVQRLHRTRPPARRIPLSRRSHITGFQSLKTGTAEHESTLERDFVTLTCFVDPSAIITSQPWPHCLTRNVTKWNRCLIRNVTRSGGIGTRKFFVEEVAEQVWRVIRIRAASPYRVTSSVRQPVTKLREAIRRCGRLRRRQLPTSTTTAARDNYPKVLIVARHSPSPSLSQTHRCAGDTRRTFWSSRRTWVSEQGKRLNIRKATLREWRQDFARRLREQGVAANATERAVRGQARKPLKDGIYRAAVRGVSRHLRDRVTAIGRDLASGQFRAGPGRDALQRTCALVLGGWRQGGERLGCRAMAAASCCSGKPVLGGGH
jgi:hypothetical protein